MKQNHLIEWRITMTDMGLGKTYIGSEKAMSFNKNILVICQKSKINDWVEHFKSNYNDLIVCDLTHKGGMMLFLSTTSMVGKGHVGIINYDLAFRRQELADLNDFTLILDESSLIQNPTAKRTKFILKKLNPTNCILLSGTPTSGKYEKLWSQMHLLGWNITKDLYFRQYVIVKISEQGYPVIKGYKNVERLKHKMREYGCVFKKTEEVLNLPSQNFIDIKIPTTKEYKYFKKNRVVAIDDKELVGDTTLTNMLYQRMLCGMYNDEKLKALQDLIDSTEDRLIIFYNFNEELERIKKLCNDRPISVVNGKIKDLTAYNDHSDSITLVQYQSGSMGLNLQLSNKIIYFSPPLSSELYEQSKKRTHRIGQENPCFYYQLKCGIDERIYNVLSMRKDYTDKLFEEDELNE